MVTRGTVNLSPRPVTAWTAILPIPYGQAAQPHRSPTRRRHAISGQTVQVPRQQPRGGASTKA